MIPRADMPETAELPQQRTARPQRLLGRLSTWNALVLALALLVLLITTLEWREYRHAQRDLQLRAHTVATLYAGRLASRLDAQFASLRFLASTLRESVADATPEPNDQISQTLKEFLRLNPGLLSVAVLSPTDNAVIDSSGATPRAATLSAAHFTPIWGQANAALGIASQGTSDTVSLRYRETDGTGRAPFLLSARYRTADLLASTDDFSPPWTS